MLLIIGLGNPGKKYQNNWHNLGFLALQIFAKKISALPFKKSVKFKAQISQGSFAGQKIILAMPQTFMNLSGQAVAALANFYKIPPADIWLINDDLDLPLGKIRISQDSSAAGHKGVLSIIEMLNSQAMLRFRLGIMTESGKNTAAENYVLQNPAPQDSLAVKQMLAKTADAIAVALEKGIAAAKNSYN